MTAREAAVWLRDHSDRLGCLQLSMALRDPAMTIVWNADRRVATVASPGGVTHLSEQELDGAVCPSCGAAHPVSMEGEFCSQGCHEVVRHG